MKTTETRTVSSSTCWHVGAGKGGASGRTADLTNHVRSPNGRYEQALLATVVSESMVQTPKCLVDGGLKSA